MEKYYCSISGSRGHARSRQIKYRDALLLRACGLQAQFELVQTSVAYSDLLEFCTPPTKRSRTRPGERTAMDR